MCTLRENAISKDADEPRPSRRAGGAGRGIFIRSAWAIFCPPSRSLHFPPASSLRWRAGSLYYSSSPGGRATASARAACVLCSSRALARAGRGRVSNLFPTLELLEKLGALVAVAAACIRDRSGVTSSHLAQPARALRCCTPTVANHAADSNAGPHWYLCFKTRPAARAALRVRVVMHAAFRLVSPRFGFGPYRLADPRAGRAEMTHSY